MQSVLDILFALFPDLSWVQFLIACENGAPFLLASYPGPFEKSGPVYEATFLHTASDQKLEVGKAWE